MGSRELVESIGQRPTPVCPGFNPTGCPQNRLQTVLQAEKTTVVDSVTGEGDRHVEACIAALRQGLRVKEEYLQSTNEETGDLQGRAAIRETRVGTVNAELRQRVAICRGPTTTT